MKKKGNIKSETYSLKDLMDFLKNNPVFIPGFQRGFVWNVNMIKDLYKSILNKDPIGTIIIWETKNKKDFKGRPFFNNIKDGKIGKKYYIIDGQQRLLSLFFLFNKDRFTNDKQELFKRYYDPDVSDEGQIIDFRKFYFDDKDELSYDTNADEAAIELLKWHKFKWFDKQLTNLKYNFVLEFVSFPDVKNEVEHALGSFEKLNRKGKKLTVEDIFLAYIWNANPKFEDEFHNWREKQRRGKGNICASIDEGVVINTFSMIYQISNQEENGKEIENIKLRKGLKELLEIANEIKCMVKKRKGDNSIKLLKETLEALESSVLFLQDPCQIRNFEEIPSQSILVVLAIFFWYCNGNVPSKKNLRKWFWRVALDSRYSGKGYTNILKDPIKMIKKTDKFMSHFPKLTKPEIINALIKNKISSGNSSFIKSMKFVLFKEQEESISGGEDIFPSRIGIRLSKSKKAEDHFFPKYLAKEGIDILDLDYVNNIANLVFLTNGMNLNKSNKLPFIFLEELYKKSKINKQEIKVFLKANLIPKNYHNFIKQAKKERKFYDEELKKFRSGVKSKIRNYYWRFNDLRTKIISDELYKLQM
jgi:hypothetical protein